MEEEVEKERHKFKANDRAGYLQRRLPAPFKALAKTSRSAGPGCLEVAALAHLHTDSGSWWSKDT